MRADPSLEHVCGLITKPIRPAEMTQPHPLRCSARLSFCLSKRWWLRAGSIARLSATSFAGAQRAWIPSRS